MISKSSEEYLKTMYVLKKQNGKLKDVSIKNLVNFLYSNKSNPMISASLASSSDMLNLAHTIVNNTTTKFTYKEISKLTGTNEAQVNKIFGVYDYNKDVINFVKAYFQTFIFQKL